MVEGDFKALEALLGKIAFALSPRERRGLATKIGQSLRRSNSQRIARNVQPDGSAMEARKPRPGSKRPGRMFPRLRMARLIRNRADADGVEVSFAGQAAAVAEVHHFGQVGAVGRTRDGRLIRTRYAQRHLLGIGPDDEEDVLAAIEKQLAAIDR